MYVHTCIRDLEQGTANGASVPECLRFISAFGGISLPAYSLSLHPKVDSFSIHGQ